MHQYGYIGRKLRLPKLQDQPAIIIATFGSSSKGQAAMDEVEAQLAENFADHQIYWAYTSEIIRRKRGLPSLLETLAKVESDGYRKAVVQPLQVFPGTEYQQVRESSLYFPGLRVIVGETLCHRWNFIEDVLEEVSADFLTGNNQINLLALHGTPLAADPVNMIYIGISDLVSGMYDNVYAATVEGVPNIQSVAGRIKKDHARTPFTRIRLIPMMFLAGTHVEDDLMGEQESWRTRFEAMGMEVDCPAITCGAQEYFKGLAFRKECIQFFCQRLKRALDIMKHY
ncbi:MAG: sirohydrochlorin cobaltochelatase [Desulfobacter postgatei]|jgi:sirohydrochlorin cobaltochelatase|uniref:Cobalamin biosynthesis protein CbiK, Co2+ chelatase n=1 Tax=Desulfobacter postgatei 2ac9 TaxID=879212 RepID=I5AXZ0_9BACT|nr:sirohydrochlorin cobaltochelatase [Desulfobacter postgatei]EIM62103.1 cobalamin biosynthesis protein CbiK, Co2+ chelatase [Desulfobacter postgatei 2ac9]MDD4273660.1 sirohydrochlorin cobaltochelatase [Desulfobacter postgatei]MDX9963603.1 sirohydrochlorin cobaltochelatase [Desulfobacter postgatei]